MLDEYGVNAEEKAREVNERILKAFNSQPDPYPNAWTGDGIYNNMPGRHSLPAFAQGGIVDRPTLAWVGEGNEAEAILPMSKLNALLKSNEEAHERLLISAYYALLPLRAKYGVGGGDITTTNNNQRAVTYNIEKIEINNPNDARMATMQLESMGGGLT